MRIVRVVIDVHQDVHVFVSGNFGQIHGIVNLLRQPRQRFMARIVEADVF